ncbi:MAG: LuxR C-terminal-related transcriptional regulator [Solirubrobacteraceae bacterium]
MSDTIAGPALTGPLGQQLQERLTGATDSARRTLAAAGQTVSETEAADDAARAALIARLAALVGEPGAAEVAEHEASLVRLRNRYDTRFQALAAVRGAVGRLRPVTSPASMLARAPAALCDASNVRRAVLSLAGEGQMIASAAHFTGDGPGAGTALAQLRAQPIRLEHPLIETELLRRRRATIVDDAQVHPRVDRHLVSVLRCSSYAAAPLVVGAQVIGMIHADRGPGERLDVLDRDVLWEFASLLADAYESASLRRTLRHEREQMREFLDWVGARSGELTDAPVRLATIQRASRPPIALPQAVPAATGARDDRVVFEGLLTRRELDVLRLLADGSSNRAIAQALVISDGTVKFHVNSILRKLRVANRAEAVARYLRLLGMRAP